MFQSIIDIFMQDPIGQFIGLLATGVVLYAFSQKDDDKVIKILLFSNLLWIIHFGLLGVYVAMMTSAMGAVRKGLALKYKGNTTIFYIIFFATLGLGFFTYKDLISFLPLLASLLTTYGFFFLKRLKLRLVFFVASTFWLTYNYLNASIGGVINEVFVQMIQVYTIYKILESRGTTSYYFQKFAELFKKPQVDYGRFLALLDFRTMLKHNKRMKKILSPFRKVKKIVSKK